jgi:ferric-dicitrate binding protein FerR (iron transport regulator)
MNDEDLERLLQSAGPREKPPAEVERVVRERAHAEWTALVRERRAQRRQRTHFALAAGLVAAAVGLWTIGSRIGEPALAVGALAAASGEVRETSGWMSGWRTMKSGEVLVAGRTIETGSAGRAALALAEGVSVRLDRGTRIVIAEPDRLRLERGMLYVDSGSDSRRVAGLRVETPSGTVRHVGTQYELRLMQAGIRLRVREGQVEWRSPAGLVERGHTGEQLVISGDGAVRREPAPRFGSTWDWVAQAAPAIDLEGMPLTRFLAWAGRELGRRVTYAPGLAEPELATIVVHGSTEGLTPPEALHAVLATTSVQATVADDRIYVERRGITSGEGARRNP